MTSNMRPDDLRTRLLAEAERIEEDCTYNSVGHYSAATRWKVIDHAFAFPTAILSAIAAFTVFQLPTLATALTILTTLLALASLYFRPAETAALHYRSGWKATVLREKARVFREITLAASQVSEEELLRQLAELHEEKRVISELGVPLPDFAYAIAKRKIAAGQAAYDRDLRERS